MRLRALLIQKDVKRGAVQYMERESLRALLIQKDVKQASSEGWKNQRLRALLIQKDVKLWYMVIVEFPV